MEHLLRFLDEHRGRRKELADALGITPAAISMWRRVPVERVLEVARHTGIDQRCLRPDIFGPAPGESGEEPAEAAQ